MDNSVFGSATGLAAEIRAGKITARTAVDHYLEQIQRGNGDINAVVTIDAKGARALAGDRDAELAKGMIRGPLHGVPITIKDTYRVYGMTATAGYPPLKDFVPDSDAVIVRLLREAGAIILGKTNTCTLAMDMQTDNPIYGRTSNPWDLSRTPGGSSGGCAAALASGMTPLSFGSDLAGSARLPPSFCGVAGFKPTHGVVSFEGHVPPLPGKTNGFRTLAVPGVLARTVGDLRLGFGIVSQPSAHDRFVTPLLPERENRDIGALRIAWMDDFGGVPVSGEVREKMHAFIDTLARAGATVERVEPQGINYEAMWELWGAFVGAQTGYEMSNFKRSIGDLMARSTVRDSPMQRKIVGPISVEGLMRAIDEQSRYVTMMENFLSRFDAWIVPVSSGTAFEHREPYRHFGDFRLYRPLSIDGRDVPYYVATQSFTTVPTVTESPVVSLPIGLGSSGLPVGVQVIGRRHGDRDLLNIAEVLERHAEPIVYPTRDR